jgi:hypothetical protein
MKTHSQILLLKLVPIALLIVSFSVHAVSGAGMKACEMAVLEKPKFHDLPMAAVSVYPGKKENHAHFTVRWDGLKADGNCKVSGSYVEKVTVKKYKDGRSGNQNGDNWEHSNDLDGFYYDEHQGKWRDPGGRICHTCTPENGFPDHSRGYHSDYRPKNEYEKHMQKDIRNMLSDQDIKNLNILTDGH